MDDATWDEIMGTQTGIDAPAVDEAATAAAAPEAESPLTEEPTAEVVEPESPAVAESAEPVETAEAVAAPEPEPEPQVDWRELPEAKAVLEKAQRMELLEQRAMEARRIQQQQQFQERLTELADGDSERFQSLTGLMAEATTPLAQMAQAQHQRAESSEKLASALWIAMEAVLTPEQRQQILDEHTTLMGVEGVEVMQRLAFGKRDSNQRVNQVITEKDREIAELRRQLAAKAALEEREATGSDLVDGGGGSNTPPDMRTQLEQAEDMDAYWNAMFGRAA